MSHPTHRYTGTGLNRANGPDVEPGGLCTPTDAELRAFGDLFERLHPDEVPGDEPADDYEPEAPADEPHGADVADSAVEDAAEARAVLRENGIDPDEYRELQAAAGEYDDVKGNLPAGELQLRLAEKLA